MDGITHLDLRRKFHLRALLDEVEATDDRAAIRFFAFGSSAEREEQGRTGGTPLRELYPAYGDALAAGYTAFAGTLLSLKSKLDELTLGAIRSEDVPTFEAAFRLIGSCLGERAP